MQTITESAFAKLNLTLDVLGKRADGYHDIRSVEQTISLRDDVVVSIGTNAPWALHCYREQLSSDDARESVLETDGFPQDSDNLAWRAAEAFFLRTDLDPEGLEIFINKRIPMQAGLGGGSADAADVPFCTLCGTAVVEGRGELLRPLPPAPEMYFVICKPDFSVSTPELYQKFDETVPEKRPDHKVMLSNLQKGQLLGIGGSLCNVFEPLVMQEHFDINYIKSMMITYGAYGAQMTGSGSAVFGIYDSFEYATVACTMLRERYQNIYLATTV